MAWTSPRTWVSGEVPTATIMNGHIRDNILEDCAATVTTAGDLSYADAANSMGGRVPIGSAGSLLVSDGSAPVWRRPRQAANFGGLDRTAQLIGVGPDGSVVGLAENDNVSTSAQTSSTSYVTVFRRTVDSAIQYYAGPTCSLTTGTHALVIAECQSVSVDTTTVIGRISYAVNGDTTSAADDTKSAAFEPPAANVDVNLCMWTLDSGLSAGSNNFVFAAKVSSGNMTIVRPRIIVVPL